MAAWPARNNAQMLLVRSCPPTSLNGLFWTMLEPDRSSLKVALANTFQFFLASSQSRGHLDCTASELCVFSLNSFLPHS